jgi:hypothetical protein
MTRDQWLSVLRGAGIAAAGAAGTYLLSWASTAPLGPWAPLVTAGLSVLVNVVRKSLEPTPAP